MFYEVSTEVMEEVESQLGELNGEAFQTTMTDFWTAIQELSKDPSSSVTQGLIVQRASEFVQRAGAVYDGLSSYQDNLNTQIKQNVDKINKYGNQLLTLNDQKPQGRLEHYRIFIEADHLGYPGHGQAGSLVELQFVGQMRFLHGLPSLP